MPEHRCLFQEMSELKFRNTLKEKGINRVVFAEEVGSTNEEALKASAEAPNFTLFIADHQRSGRGRLSHSWLQEPRSSIAMTLVTRLHSIPHQGWPLLPLISGMAVHRALADYGVRTSLKWPNDIYMGDKKLGGILVEHANEVAIPTAVVGIGLNVWSHPEIPERPTVDLRDSNFMNQKKTGEPATRAELIVSIIDHLIPMIRQWRKENTEMNPRPHGDAEPEPTQFSKDLIVGYTQASSYIHERVRIQSHGTELHGMVYGFGPQGQLLLDTDSGLHSILSGEAFLLRKDES